jgi:hypothetical protein
MNSGFGVGAAPLTAGVSGAVVTSELPAGVLGFFFITCRQRSQRKRVIVERQMLAISLSGTACLWKKYLQKFLRPSPNGERERPVVAIHSDGRLWRWSRGEQRVDSDVPRHFQFE